MRAAAFMTVFSIGVCWACITWKITQQDRSHATHVSIGMYWGVQNNMDLHQNST